MMGKTPVKWCGWLMLTALLALLPWPSHANDKIRLANLTQDVELLSRQVAILRSEVEALRRENAQLKATVASGSSSDSLRFVRESMESKFASFRQEIAASNTAHSKELLTQVNAKLTELARLTKTQVDGIAGAVTAIQGQKPKGPVKVVHPKTGIVYKVRSGDTLSAIARKHVSTVPWIKAANGIVEDTSLQVDREIFVAQKN